MRNKLRYDANVTFTTARIAKNSLIDLYVLDAGSDAVIFNVNGTVDYYLKHQTHKGEELRKKLQNRIETVSFWRDEYH